LGYIFHALCENRTQLAFIIQDLALNSINYAFGAALEMGRNNRAQGTGEDGSGVVD
jgi:hypothetical protein